jgi:aspartate 1-decarboxylase
MPGILPHEQVDVLNINTGGRFTTYAIEAPRCSRAIAVNGAAARLVQTGDKVIIVAYCQVRRKRRATTTPRWLCSARETPSSAQPNAYSYRSASMGFMSEARRAG